MLPPRPQLGAPEPVAPEHDDEAAQEAGEVARANVSVKGGHAGEEDGCVEEVELGPRELFMQEEQDDGRGGADEEPVGDHLEEMLLEQAPGPDEHVLHAQGEAGRERLPRPLVRGVLLDAGEVVELGVEDPADDGVVDGDADEGAEDLGEEDGLGRDVHVVADLHVLQVELGAVPGVAGDGAVGRRAARVLPPGHGVDHEPVQQLVGRPDGELEVDSAYSQPSGTTTTAPVAMPTKYVHTGMKMSPRAQMTTMMTSDTANSAANHQKGIVVRPLQHVDLVVVLLRHLAAVPGRPPLQELFHAGPDLPEAEERHPHQRRRVGRVVEEHVPQVLRADVEDPCCAYAVVLRRMSGVSSSERGYLVPFSTSV